MVRIFVSPPSILLDADVSQSGLQLVSVGNFSYILRSGDGILVYKPNDDYSECTVYAVCEVVSTYPDVGRTSLDIRPLMGIVRPDSHARHRWRNSPYLCPDIHKVKKYGLLDFFNSAFGSDAWSTDRLEDRKGDVFRPDLSVPTLVPVEGIVYLMRGSHLHKIGKTVNLTQRKKRIERDVQESVEVVHSISSNDITRAELSLHKKYKEQRRWGEWFDLSDEQVSEICTVNRIDY
jgi:hypothetical protein